LTFVFNDVARILAESGRSAFVTGDRSPEEPTEVVACPEQTGTGMSVTMYLHTPGQIAGWLEKNRFMQTDSVEFTVWMDEKGSKEFPVRAYIARKTTR
jgi:hypothetical protein